MERTDVNGNVNVNNMAGIMKSLLTSYITTSIALLILAYGLYKFDLTEQTVQGGIIAIYVLSAFVGGRGSGKRMKVRRFFWGLITGIIYYVLLLCISFLVYRGIQTGTEAVFHLGLCALGGMFGGMLS